MISKYGLIGKDIAYSKSPELHKIISEVYNLAYDYEIIDIYQEEVDTFLQDSSFQGFNVTKPYKESIITKVNKLSIIAKKTGAINTIYRRNNKLFGDNTDYQGFKYLIKYYNINLRKQRILILGTGGAAKTVYQYVTKYTKHVLYASRTKQDKNTISYNQIINHNFDIIINATPNGLYPNTDDVLINANYLADKIFIDLIYNPKVTKMMSQSKESYNGLVMLIVQAIYSVKKWHKVKIKIDKQKIDFIKEKMTNV